MMHHEHTAAAYDAMSPAERAEADHAAEMEHRSEQDRREEQPKRIKTTDPDQVRQHIAQLGQHRGGYGTQCDYHADWSEQSYERGAVRTVKPKRGSKYWILFTH